MRSLEGNGSRKAIGGIEPREGLHKKFQLERNRWRNSKVRESGLRGNG